MTKLVFSKFKGELDLCQEFVDVIAYFAKKFLAAQWQAARPTAFAAQSIT
jgi:hypothetical protein